MQYSYNWLKKYVPDLPAPEKVEEGIIFHAFEVEGIDKKGEDTLMAIKVLPDRAHDCLCHEGVAREVSAIFDLPFSLPKNSSDLISDKAQDLNIKIEDNLACRRYVGVRVKNIKIGPSPNWLAKALEALGQRSINNIVDSTNYVMFDIGQPMHAFDADKLEGDIVVRRARAGEKMTTLDNKDLLLDESILVITDNKGPLALAGIKGGNRAEVDTSTKNLILESANFDPVLIRRTSAKVGIRTDASKAFENNLSSETALLAMVRLVNLLQEVAGGEYGGVVDIYPVLQIKTKINISAEYVSDRLGLEIPVSEIKNILERLGIEVLVNGQDLDLTIPHWRVDLQEGANIVEEVGRIYGYEKIKPELLTLPEGSNFGAGSLSERRFAVKNKLREILAKAGFVEVMGYALTNKGEIELANPLSIDKAWLRTNLSDWLSERIAFNLNYVLFDNEPVKIFEIGEVFKAGYREETILAIGTACRDKKYKPQEELGGVAKTILEVLGLTEKDGFVRSSRVVNEKNIEILEFSFDKIAEELEVSNLDEFMSSAFNYKPISNYPRIIRDIAFWVPTETDIEATKEMIKKEAGELLIEGPVLFDEFTKEEKKSLAFRLVFQSYSKTLQDIEVNEIMEKLNGVLAQKGFTVR